MNLILSLAGEIKGIKEVEQIINWFVKKCFLQGLVENKFQLKACDEVVYY